jgi:hypothetical protein
MNFGNFVTDLHDVLDGVLSERPALFGDHAASLVRAWGEVETRFADVESHLNDASLTVNTRLDDHGLIGHALNA